ncbi:TonB family protein [Aurantiacibacter marinus]|uniref:TonB C-terminal domain-containing protein n=1 Tax=Aurantiacibacter marinus TaxID=874156 RepID=A0A0H0XSF5_9SPHN|nr:TonB family protein [Aurantiacibacter marinus]KLI63245.1 hypothetical protein AAV99_11260 [Aurantiacibacter marinus]
MAYTDAGSDPAIRGKAAVTVIGIHALLGFGLVAGLAVKSIIVEPEPDIIGTEVIYDVPPPVDPIEPVPETPVPPTSTPQVPDSPFVFTTPTDITVAPVTDSEPFVVRVPTPSPIPMPGTNPGPVPTPSPEPIIAPVSATPNNGPTGWITNNDYSRSDLTRGREGTASYRLVVGSDGRVDACEITSGTGHASLDRTTCRLIERRARFNAATDNRGARVVGTYSGSVTWRIPE